MRGSARGSRAEIGGLADPSWNDYTGANPEEADEYRAENIFWVAAGARWSYLQTARSSPTFGKIIDEPRHPRHRSNVAHVEARISN